MGSFQFTNELSAARHIMADADTLRQFFKGYMDCLLDAGMEISDAAGEESNPEEAALDEVLEPLSQLARVVREGACIVYISLCVCMCVHGCPHDSSQITK